MTIGLANSAKRSRNYGQTVNQNQGGGDKKAGFPFMVGRNQWDSIFIKNQPLARLQKTLVFANSSRPISSWTAGNSYWRVTG